VVATLTGYWYARSTKTEIGECTNQSVVTLGRRKLLLCYTIQLTYVQTWINTRIIQFQCDKMEQVVAFEVLDEIDYEKREENKSDIKNSVDANNAFRLSSCSVILPRLTFKLMRQHGILLSSARSWRVELQRLPVSVLMSYDVYRTRHCLVELPRLSVGVLKEHGLCSSFKTQLNVCFSFSFSFEFILYCFIGYHRFRWLQR
jgi:hypothetical protein